MTRVITGSCCADAACVPVCPVDCIHPTPDEPDYGSAEMLYIDAATCIDCGACVDVCPVSAITTDYQLLGDVSAFEELSTRYFESGVPPSGAASTPAPAAPTSTSEELLRVAVVGAGPAGMYTVEALLDRFGDRVRIDLIERLPAPWGPAQVRRGP